MLRLTQANIVRCRLGSVCCVPAIWCVSTYKSSVLHGSRVRDAFVARA